ncbi:MAG TPA: MBL fold metallo-hydrolase [Gemmatimonadaceae bacterium]|nr:MBL fold metallo-hydrolase [Gemmatimonadaceae bacterium]
MIVRTLTVGPLEENAYLVVDETTRRGVLIDPGEEAELLLDTVRDERAELEAIWLTHGHMDHVGAIAAIVRATPVPIYLHPHERPIYDSAAQHGIVFGLRVEQPPPPDRSLADGDTLHVGTLRFSVIHVPGHAPGHVAIHGNGVAFVGDCLFAGSVGRTDLPLASGAQLERSLERICALPDETIVYPGHGPATSIGRERRTNPFLTGTVRITGLDR